MAACNHDCFHCELDDCYNNTITKEERMESRKRDANYTTYGRIVHGKTRASLDKGRKC